MALASWYLKESQGAATEPIRLKKKHRHIARCFEIARYSYIVEQICD
jgi:hypothetical protein